MFYSEYKLLTSCSFPSCVNIPNLSDVISSFKFDLMSKNVNKNYLGSNPGHRDQLWYISFGFTNIPEHLGLIIYILLHVLLALYSQLLTAWSVGLHIGSPRDSLAMTRVCDSTSQHAPKECVTLYDIIGGVTMWIIRWV